MTDIIEPKTIEHADKSQQASELLRQALQLEPQKPGMTKEERAQAEKQIAENKLPICVLRDTDPSFTAGNHTFGPFVQTSIYEHGKFLADRSVTHDSTTFDIVLDNVEYFDLVRPDGKDSIMRTTGVKDGEIFPVIKEGSSQYNKVVSHLKKLDFDRVVDCL